jgi:NAD-dependent dihydropyrimidine dehydrogenase PreA subunit
VPHQPFDLKSRVDAALAEQRELTAVELFSQRHDEDALDQSPIYRDLIPEGPPGAGEQFAFEVDMDRCTGCKACVTACHNLNGLSENETWRSVGLLLGGS